MPFEYPPIVLITSENPVNCPPPGFCTDRQQPQNSTRSLVFNRIPSGARNLSLWGPRSTPSTHPESEVAVSSVETATSATESPESLEGSSAAVGATTEAGTIPVGPLDQGVSDTQPFLSEFTEAIVNNTPAALQYGDLAAMGLAGWSPAGIIRWSFELINVTSGLPWFWTIVAGSVFWRAVCVPFAIKGLQASARLQPHQAQMKALQTVVQDAQATKNPIEMQKAALAMREFYAKNNINPLAAMIPLIQMPITIGLFFAAKKMCELEQLKISGFSLLPDLTVADPTYILPVVMLGAIHTQIFVSKSILSLSHPIQVIYFFAARSQGYKYHRAACNGPHDEPYTCCLTGFNTVHGELPSCKL